MYLQKKPDSRRRWTLALERNGQSLDWFASSAQEKAALLQGDLETLVREVTFRQIVKEVAEDGSEKELGRTEPLRSVYFYPILVAQKYAEKHGACPKIEKRYGTTPNLGVTQSRVVRLDESCLLVSDWTKTLHAGDAKREETSQEISFLNISGGAFYPYLDKQLSTTVNDKGERVFSDAQAKEYLDQMHVAFLASIEKLAAVETKDEQLEADEKIRAQKFYHCREERTVEGVDEAEFVKRVFGN